MPTVVIFDSGVGGLSIYQQVKTRLPGCDYILVSDNLAFPYGGKPEQALNQRVVEVVQRINRHFCPDLVVVACNTASTVVLPLLRATSDIPVVGVVPAIKPAGKLSNTRHIGLLATPATIQRSYTDQLIADFAADCRVTKVGSSKMVELAESKLSAETVELAAIEMELIPFLEAEDCDTIVLGCTHFPLLNKEILSVFKAKKHVVNLVDSGLGIANRVASLLAGKVSGSALHNGRSIAVFTRQLEQYSNFIVYLEQQGVHYQGLLQD
ncbi:MAG: glutamate racemase [Gammaproteobacteria bacterium]|nr:glutamate racemase [Gammaproteobacteria bacterium]